MCPPMVRVLPIWAQEIMQEIFFVKDLGRQGSSVQRTNRTGVIDFSYSPDGKYICFSESRGKTNQIFQTSAGEGYVCRQITNGSTDYSPVYSDDMSQIFFARQETEGVSIWSYNVESNFLSTYTTGMNPYPLKSNRLLFVPGLMILGKAKYGKSIIRLEQRSVLFQIRRKVLLHLFFRPTGGGLYLWGAVK